MNEKRGKKLKMKEREINLLYLLKFGLEKWKRICAGTIVIAIFFTVGSYYVELRQAYVDSNTTQASQEEAINNLSESDQQEVETVLNNRKILQNYLEYQSDSILMNINPYKENRVILEYYTSASNELVTKSVQAYVDNQILAHQVQEQLGEKYSEENIGELIKYSKANVREIDNTVVVLEQPDDNEVFSIYVIGADATQAANIADVVEQVFQEYMVQMSDKFTPATINLQQRSQSVVSDSELANEQNVLATNIGSTQVRINTLINSLSDAQKSIIEMDEGIETTTEATTGARVSINLMTIAIGLLLGLVVMMAVYILLYILKPSLKYEEEIQDVFQIQLLGEIKKENKKNGQLDKWIKQLNNTKQPSAEEQLNRIHQMLLYQCINKEVRKICFVSSVELLDDDKQNLRKLQDVLIKSNVQTIVVDHVFSNGDNLEELLNCKDIVLVEKNNQSRFKNINKEMEMLTRQQQNILGYIVI